MNDPSQKKILVIDDDPLVRRSVEYCLEDGGYLVVSAEDGERGLEIIEQELPDMVIADLRMPKVDGREVLAEVKKNFPDIPVIIISGAGIMDDVADALHSGAWDYLIKPIENMDILLHTVEKALERVFLIKEAKLCREQLMEKTEKLP